MMVAGPEPWNSSKKRHLPFRRALGNLAVHHPEGALPPLRLTNFRGFGDSGDSQEGEESILRSAQAGMRQSNTPRGREFPQGKNLRNLRISEKVIAASRLAIFPRRNTNRWNVPLEIPTTRKPERALPPDPSGCGSDHTVRWFGLGAFPERGAGPVQGDVTVRIERLGN
jgi:hypothetical protein